jgi:hypothetical protein
MVQIGSDYGILSPKKSLMFLEDRCISAYYTIIGLTGINGVDVQV